MARWFGDRRHRGSARRSGDRPRRRGHGGARRSAVQRRAGRSPARRRRDVRWCAVRTTGSANPRRAVARRRRDDARRGSHRSADHARRRGAERVGERDVPVLLRRHVGSGPSFRGARIACGDADVVFTGGLALVLQPLADTVSSYLVGAVVHDDGRRRRERASCAHRRPGRLRGDVAGGARPCRPREGQRRRPRRARPRLDVAAMLAAGARAVVDDGRCRSDAGLRRRRRVRSVAVADPAAPIVDTIGAGDTFVGALLAAWTTAGLRPRRTSRRRGLDRAGRAVEAGHAAAAIVVTRHGADPRPPPTCPDSDDRRVPESSQTDDGLRRGSGGRRGVRRSRRRARPAGRRRAGRAIRPAPAAGTRTRARRPSDGGTGGGGSRSRTRRVRATSDRTRRLVTQQRRSARSSPDRGERSRWPTGTRRAPGGRGCPSRRSAPASAGSANSTHSRLRRGGSSSAMRG